ncbi:uncharacterized protein [Rutidosis leptorrhynchoides]|uniref:uncharacterized protein n=1 Tax=Rutidosis leptorrhynchoides TaxID=125765 RepID=UPI003A98D097
MRVVIEESWNFAIGGVQQCCNLAGGLHHAGVHGMLKFPTPAGVATIRMQEMEPIKCMQIFKGSSDIVVHDNVYVSPNPKYPDQRSQIGATLSTNAKDTLCKLLQANIDVFVGDPSDMTGVPREIAQHRLNVNPNITPVVQKKRAMALERSEFLDNELQRLVDASIMKKVKYQTWVANPVMVKKADESWRMCVDYKDINKACPKDNYPLPKMDCKVKSLSGFQFLSFLDAYRGYQQIPMAETDEGKTAFFTNKGIFCYTKMPFGLKNAGATYQQTLKGCLSKKDFFWTDEAERAFQYVKAFLKEFPALTAPIPGETLTVYLAASSEAISSVLIADSGKTQMPVYYVSKVLQNGEVKYPAMEKLIYAFVHAARRLRRYFQEHPIQVFMDQPIKHVLTRPEISGRMAKWAIELGEHEITFLPRHSVNSQVIADFLVELPSDMTKQGETTVTRREMDEFWELYKDGESSEEGAGIRILLVSPNGEEITYAIRLKFAASYNEAEYEALIAGLRLAKSIDVRQLTAYIDSQLVASQLNGSFEARDTSMQKYLELTKTLTNTFTAFEIK